MNTQSTFLRAFWILPILLLLSLSAYAVDGQIKIAQTASTTFPIVIDQPGSYILASNLVVEDRVTAIEIIVSNVTLDLNGHSINGPGKPSGVPLSGNGITSSQSGMTVVNGTITGFGEYGVKLFQGSHLVRNLKVNSNGYGIVANNSVISETVATNNLNWGIAANSSIITECVVSDNGPNGRGLVINAGSNVTSCAVSGNLLGGIQCGGSIVTYSTVTNNVGPGIDADGDCQIIGNNVSNNSGWGLRLSGVAGAPGHNYAIKNRASGNATGNFYEDSPPNYMPTSLTAPDAANANIGW